MSNRNYTLFKLKELYDVYGTPLISTEEVIDTKFIKKIASISQSSDSQIIISSTSVVDDLETIMKSGIYNVIFSGRGDSEKIINTISQIQINTCLFDEMQKIKNIMPCTYYHLLSVAALSLKIGLDLKDREYDPVMFAKIGLVHDMGKSRLPIEILEKEKPLTGAEFKVIQTHPIIEYILLSYYLKNADSSIAQTTFSHHERLDGSGYPRGITSLDKYVQIIMVCDIFDALISMRPYRNEPYTVRAALDLLLEESQKGKINKKYVVCLISYIRRDKPNFNNLKVAVLNRDAPPQINYYGIRDN